MKKIAFYILTNNLYKMSSKNYLAHIKKNVLSQEWFKKACKEKKIKVNYLSRSMFTSNLKDNYLIYDKNIIYFFKFFLLKFEYEKLENNNHLKLLNINIKNETVFNVVKILFYIQRKFLKSSCYKDINLIARKEFISIYVNKYKSYIDASILSKILNNIIYSNNNLYKLTELLPKKAFLYSLYIKNLINLNYSSLKDDHDISQMLLLKYNINLTRRQVCDIRNKYMISKVKKKKNFNFYMHYDKFYDKKRKLNKNNISLLLKNTVGIYELSSTKNHKLSFRKSDILYIGSSKNIKKRLFTYTSLTAHSKDLKKFLKENEKIYFRILQTLDYKKFEMLFINSFMEITNELPKLNKQRILNIKLE